jgi:hypothetical protein
LPGRRRRRKGILRKSWKQEITSGMREKGINSMEWRLKIKLYTQKYVKALTLFT